MPGSSPVTGNGRDRNPPAGTVVKQVFLNATVCPTQAWHQVHESGTEEPTPGDLFRMDQGREVHRRARNTLPGGILMDEPGIAAAVDRTRKLMGDPAVDCLFEPAFQAAGCSARADILRRHGQGWELIEVKSDTREKPELVDDLAYTAMVLQRCATHLERASLWVISKDYRLGMPDEALFVEIDRTDAVQERLASFEAHGRELAGVLGRPQPPPASLIPACRQCPYFATHCMGVGVEHPLFDLPRLHESKLAELAGQGIMCVEAVPDDFPLTEAQAKVRQAVVSGQPVVGAGLARALEEVVWPAHYLDFETVMTVLPLHGDIAPYEQVPVQYSIHICPQPGQVDRHHEYLADPAHDCRRKLAERLLEDLGDRGSIIVYTSFEQRILAYLADRFPDLAGRLQGCIDRLFDLEAVIRNHYYHPGFRGSTSIKKVLPVLVPEMSYEGLEIADGDTAMAVFARMAQGEVEDEEAVRRQMLAYCEQDTLAMVRLHERLIDVARAE